MLSLIIHKGPHNWLHASMPCFPHLSNGASPVLSTTQDCFQKGSAEIIQIRYFV